MKTQQQLKEDIVCICRMLHRKNYLAATDGNVSVRLGDQLLITPSGVNKGIMEADQVLTVDLTGAVIAGTGQPSSEIQMHLLAYRLRADVHAVVHAHLPYATACTLAGIDLLEPILPEEAVASLVCQISILDALFVLIAQAKGAQSRETLQGLEQAMVKVGVRREPVK